VSPLGFGLARVVPDRRQVRVTVRRPAEDRTLEVVFFELFLQHVLQAVDVRRREVVPPEQPPERLFVFQRGEPVVQLLERFGRLCLEPILVVESEAFTPLAVDDVLDDHERDLRDGALAPEGGEVDLLHDPQRAVPFPGCHVQVVTEGLRDADPVEVVHPLGVARHRGVLFVVETAQVLVEVSVRSLGAADPGRARRDDLPAPRPGVPPGLRTVECARTGLGREPLLDPLGHPLAAALADSPRRRSLATVG